MEVQKVQNELDANLKVLTDKFTEMQDKLNKEIKPEIKRLKATEKELLNSIAIHYGAIQAYQGCKQIVKPADAANEVIADGAA